MADEATGVKADFFISRAGSDQEMARFIAEIVREGGRVPYLQDDFGHADFMRRMEQGYSSGARMIALLSSDYQKSNYCRAEYNHILGRDPSNLNQRLIVLRVAECEPVDNLQNLAYTDLVPLMSDREAVRRTVRVAIGLETRASEIEFWRPQLRAGQQIRHPEIRSLNGFAGRQAALEALEDKLRHGRGAVAIRNSGEITVAVRGMGGVGKTTLAREYAWRRRKDYHGLWWIRAETRETLVEDLITLGKRFMAGLEGQEPEAAALAVVDRLAQMETPKPWLLVYDNAVDPDVLRRLTPPDNAHILITTRLTDWSGETDDLGVDLFDRETAVDFLLKQARRPDRDAAGRLAEALGRLPLALSHARSYCWSRNWGFDQYAEKLPELIDKAPKGAAYPVSIFATFDLAIAEAARERPEAERLMGLLAFLSPDQTPEWIFSEDVLTKRELGDALEALSAVSLVTLENLSNGEPAVSVHRLVQETMRARLRASGGFEQAAAEATRLVKEAYDWSGSFEAAEWNVFLLPQAVAVLPHAPKQGPNAGNTLWMSLQTGDLRLSRGDTESALDAYNVAQGVAERLARSNPRNAKWRRDLSVSQRKIGDVLVAQGKLSEALDSYAAARDIREHLAHSDPGNAKWRRDLSISQNKIGDVLVAQGKLPEALDSYAAARDIREHLTRSDPENAKWRRDLSVSQRKIGDILVAQGKLSEALDSYAAALHIAERLARADPGNARWRRDLSISQNNIGDVLLAQGKLSEALDSYAAARDIRERLARSDPENAKWRRDLSVSQEKIGDVLVAQGKLSEALDSYAAARDIRERLARSDLGNADWRRNLSVSQEKIGDVLRAQGKLPEALDSYAAACDIRERLARSDPENAQWRRDLSVSQRKIGDVLAAQGKLSEALDNYAASRAIADRLARSDPGNADWQRDLALSYGNIAMTQARLGDKDNARIGFQKGKAIIEALKTQSSDNATLSKDLALFDSEIAALGSVFSQPPKAQRDWLSWLRGAKRNG